MGKKKKKQTKNQNPFDAIKDTTLSNEIWNMRDELKDQSILSSLYVKNPGIHDCVLELAHSIAFHLDSADRYKEITYKLAREVDYYLDRLENR